MDSDGGSDGGWGNRIDPKIGGCSSETRLIASLNEKTRGRRLREREHRPGIARVGERSGGN